MLKAISNTLPRLTTRTGIAQWLLALMFFANVAPMFRGQSYEENYLIDQVARTLFLSILAIETRKQQLYPDAKWAFEISVRDDGNGGYVVRAYTRVPDHLSYTSY